MKKRIGCLGLLLLLVFSSVWAGDPVIDSLLRELSTARDTTKVKVLIQLSAKYASPDPNKAIDYAQQALVLSQKLDFQKGEADGYNHLASGYTHQNSYTEALNWYQKALELNREIGNGRGELAVLINMGMLYNRQENFPKAVDYYLQGLKLAEDRGDEVRMSNIYNFLGNVYADQHDYQSALRYYQQALTIKKNKFGQGRPVSQVLVNIGDIYLRQKQYAKALPYFLSGLEGLTESDRDMRATCLANLGMAYGGISDGGLKEYDKALDYLNQALSL